MLQTKLTDMNIFSRKSNLEKYAQLGKISHELFHDILNPISGLILYLEILKETETSNRNTNHTSNSQRKFLSDEILTSEIDQITSSSEKIRKFIKLIQNNLLFPEKSELINIRQEIKEIISLTYHKAKRNDVSIIFIQDSEIEINIPKIKFYQLIINLISNGIDSFSDFDKENLVNENLKSRKRKVIVKCYEENKIINLEITDNGCGIHEKDISKIFKKDYSNKSEGLGIGLKTVKKIIKETKGKIKVSSSKNIGTCFKIQIPKNH